MGKRVGAHLMHCIAEPENENVDWVDNKNPNAKSKHKPLPKYVAEQPNNEERVDWNQKVIKAYFDFIISLKSDGMRISAAANKILREYYKLVRSGSNRDKARTTVRFLESLVRLAQAHALLMYRTVVLSTD